MIQAQTRGQVLQGVNQFGVGPGGRKLIDWEAEAAEEAIQTGIYGVYRNIETGQDCTRIGPSSKCFCNHLYSEHTFVSKKSVYPRCTACPCAAFAFVPQRPEEVGDWWLPRRKGFDVRTWRAKCRCGHGHDEHDPVRRRCRCGCAGFQSNFACLSCDRKWEDHETVFETAQERLMAGKPVGDAYRPLSDDNEMREAVFPGGGASSAAAAASYQPNRLRPAQVPRERAEKSVQIMHESSGGAIKGQDVVNRYGKVANPPQQYLYGGGSGSGGGAPPPIGGTGSRQSPSALGGMTARGSLAAGSRALPTAARGRQVEASDSQQPKALASGFRPVYD